MITFDIDNKEYKLEFGFDAAENKDIVQKMFDIVSGAYIFKESANGKNTTAGLVNGVGKMISDYSEICHMAFYAGCLQHNPVTRAEAKTLVRAYITEKRMSDKKYGYYQLFEEIKTCMADDGFFDLSGLTEAMEQMNRTAMEQLEQMKTAK